MKKKIIIIICSLVILIISAQIGTVYLGNKSSFGIEKGGDKQISGIITFVSNRTDKQDEIINLINDFENIYPMVKVKLELIGDAEEILQRKASVGELADVTVVPNAISSSEFNKYFLPIDDIGFNKDNIYNYYQGTGADGKLYNLSTSLSWHGVIYNKKIFNELGMNKVPVTKKEFFKFCDKMKENNIVPIALNYKQSWIMNMWIDNIPDLYNINSKKDLMNESYSVLDDDSSFYKSMEFLRQIYKYGYCEKNLINYEWEECKNDIVQGKIAMIVWNSDFINQLVDMGMNEEDIGIFPIPETKSVIINGDYRIGVSRNTKYPEASKAFLKYLFEKDRYADAVNIMSNLKNSDSSERLLKNLNQYNIDIKFKDDIISKINDNEKKQNSVFSEIKNSAGIDYNLVQKYIIAPDTDVIRKNVNEKWKSEKLKYR
ncbi:MAG: extracellular solute-binding protein [Clostridium butyricum]|nr:extracellular solute-binding protein [Clostridium butyricum]